ncbi:MAG: tol-pal system-associated acyl-CoA thioesterase [Pseudomonadota bacterium]
MHQISVRVYYEDTDFGGVVYYANYLKFLERGRTEALRDLGVDQIALKEAGTVFVVRRVEADYFAPARFDDVLVVETRADWVKGASACMAQRILRDGHVLLDAKITIAAMTLEGRPTRLPADVRAGLAAMGGD